MNDTHTRQGIIRLAASGVMRLKNPIVILIATSNAANSASAHPVRCKPKKSQNQAPVNTS